MTQPGCGMAADIAEQPAVMARLLGGDHVRAVAEAAARVAAWRPRHVVLVGRGTSDHAALYGSYLVEIRLGLPAGLASPSTVTLFGARPDLSGALVVGVSQSGGSSDLTEVISAARARGALTVAITNDAQSPLAGAAELTLDVAAGPERAVAATKTYTAELLTLLLLVESVRAGGTLPAAEASALAELPALAEDVLAGAVAAGLAERYRSASRLVTTGRGYAYPTAREAALKLMETSYLPALAFSGADLMHGPVAMAASDTPVVVVAGTGPGGLAMRQVIRRLSEHGADVVSVGPADIPGAAGRLAVPDVGERYSPLLDVLPLQQLALDVALARGENPDTPRSLSKITSTR